jgi:DNA-binding transcriptional regulator YiaG
MDGAEIKALRKHLDLTQEEFAHEVGVTFATVNRWENGKSKPSRLAVRALRQMQAEAGISPPKPKAARSRARGRATRSGA